jgi:hypothetical protein
VEDHGAKGHQLSKRLARGLWLATVIDENEMHDNLHGCLWTKRGAAKTDCASGERAQVGDDPTAVGHIWSRWDVEWLRSSADVRDAA